MTTKNTRNSQFDKLPVVKRGRLLVQYACSVTGDELDEDEVTEVVYHNKMLDMTDDEMEELRVALHKNETKCRALLSTEDKKPQEVDIYTSVYGNLK